MAETLDWLEQVGRETRHWLEGQQVEGRPGLVRWAEGGNIPRPVVRTGLAPSCLALKTLVMLGGWGNVAGETRSGWVERIRSFQVLRRGRFRGAFVDRRFLWRTLVDSGWRATGLRPRAAWRYVVDRIRAESRQAISALAEVGVETAIPPPGFLWTRDVRSFTERLDWSRPWAAGAHLSSLLFFGSLWLKDNPEDLARFREEAAAGLGDVHDPASGGWHRDEPSPEQVINGAMKVLTGLAWLSVPVPEPERLIDYCLEHPPKEHGCSMTDRIYVFQRCAAMTSHREDEVRRDAEEFIEAVKPFYHEGGGFRYYPDRSQTHYYGARITEGRRAPDIHGTCLFVWGLSLAAEIVGLREDLGWRTMRP